MSRQKPYQLLETIVQQIPGDKYPDVHDALTELRQVLAPKVSKTGKQQGRPPKKSINGPMVAWFVERFTAILKDRKHSRSRMTAYELAGIKFELCPRYVRKMTRDFAEEASEPRFSAEMYSLVDCSSVRSQGCISDKRSKLRAEIDQLLARLNYNKNKHSGLK